MLICMRKISSKIKKFMVTTYDSETIHSIVDVLLFNKITNESLNYLDFLDSLKFDDDFSAVI